MITRRVALGLIGAAGSLRPAKAEPIDARAYGAAGNGRHDDSGSLGAAGAACIAMGRPLYIPGGHYRIEKSLVWDVSAASRIGMTVYGDGAQATVLDFVDGGTGADLELCSSGPVRDSFYTHMRDFGIQGHGSGSVLQVGNADLSYTMNACSLERLVVCANGSGAAVTLNAVCGGHVDVVANAAGARRGIAMRMRQAQFCTIMGAQGNAAIGTLMDDGYNFGNVFTGIDYEVLGTAVRLEGLHCVHNSWVGGTIANAMCGFDCLAGSDNYALNINPAIPPEMFVRGAVGLRVISSMGVVATPSLPQSGVRVANNTTHPVQVGVMGGQVDLIVVNNATLGRRSDLVVYLPVGGTIRVFYRQRPSWVWLDAG